MSIQWCYGYRSLLSSVLGVSPTEMRPGGTTNSNTMNIRITMSYLLCDSRLTQGSINLQQAGVKSPLVVPHCLHWLDRHPAMLTTECITPGNSSLVLALLCI